MNTGSWVAAAGKQRVAALHPVRSPRYTSPEGGQVQGTHTFNGANGHGGDPRRGPRRMAERANFDAVDSLPDRGHGAFLTGGYSIIGMVGALLLAASISYFVYGTPRTDTKRRGWVSAAEGRGRRGGDAHASRRVKRIHAARPIGGRRRCDKLPQRDDEWMMVVREGCGQQAPPGRGRRRGSGTRKLHGDVNPVRKYSAHLPEGTARSPGPAGLADCPRSPWRMRRRSICGLLGVHRCTKENNGYGGGDWNDGDLTHRTMKRPRNLDLGWVATIAELKGGPTASYALVRGRTRMIENGSCEGAAPPR